uniref:Putative sulfotransferase n=1 Tax=viral metagenome TaxID=1070528 RepID=A0A6H1ZGZ8_9ZZZZ
MGGIIIAHVVNPVNAKPPSDLVTAQPITYMSMFRAALYEPSVSYAAYYPEDEEMVPSWFKKLRPLGRSVLDLKKFNVQRKLPLFRDILDRVVDETDADYIVQTNCDIGLMPHFYQFVKRQIEKGYRAFIINKRVIPAHYKSVDDLPEMYAELGQPHNGYDCFVFPMEDYAKYDLGDVCMGTPWSEGTLASSMVNSGECTVFKNAHVTFHVGDSRTWLDPKLTDYRIHNTNEVARVMKGFAEKNPNFLKHEIICWLLYKMKHELSPYHSQDCHDLCAMTSGLR